jgi:hypothetical protein
MHDPPATVLQPENRRAAQQKSRALVGSTDLRLESLELVNTRELRREVLRKPVEAEGSTVSVVRRCAGHRVADLRPAALRRPERVRKSDVVALREQRLQRGWISTEEFVDGAMRLLDERGEILRLFDVLNLAHQSMSPGRGAGARRRARVLALSVTSREAISRVLDAHRTGSPSFAACSCANTSGACARGSSSVAPMKRLTRPRAGYLYSQPGRGHAAALRT